MEWIYHRGIVPLYKRNGLDMAEIDVEWDGVIKNGSIL